MKQTLEKRIAPFGHPDPKWRSGSPCGFPGARARLLSKPKISQAKYYVAGSWNADASDQGNQLAGIQGKPEIWEDSP